MRPVAWRMGLQVFAWFDCYAMNRPIESFVSRSGIIPAGDEFPATALTLAITHRRVTLAHLATPSPGQPEFAGRSLDRRRESEGR